MRKYIILYAPDTTASSTLIDLIFVSSINFVHSCTTVPPLGNADHYGLQLIFSTTTPKKSSKTIKRKVWRYSLADWDRASELLDSIDWDFLLPQDVESYWSAWKIYFMQVMELCIPHTTAKIKNNPPWMNEEILRLVLLGKETSYSKLLSPLVNLQTD